jgi:hypothetical protein
MILTRLIRNSYEVLTDAMPLTPSLKKAALHQDGLQTFEIPTYDK